jgi:hypothetical protein
MAMAMRETAAQTSGVIAAEVEEIIDLIVG